MPLALSTSPIAASCTATPPCCNDRDPIVPAPTGVRSVSPHTSVKSAMSMPVWALAIDDHGRVVPLTVRRGAGVDRARAVGIDLDLGGLVHRRHATGDLDVDAHADAEQLGVAGVATLLLFGTQRGIAGVLERPVEGTLVVAAVVGLAHRRRVRCVELGEQVLAAHVDRDPSRLPARTDPSPARRRPWPPAARRRGRRRPALCWSRPRCSGPRCSGSSYTAAAMPRVNSAPRIVPMSQ